MARFGKQSRRRSASPHPVPADLSLVFADPPPASPLPAGVASRLEANQLLQLRCAVDLFGVPLDWFRPDIAAAVAALPSR